MWPWLRVDRALTRWRGLRTTFLCLRGWLTSNGQSPRRTWSVHSPKDKEFLLWKKPLKSRQRVIRIEPRIWRRLATTKTGQPSLPRGWLLWTPIWISNISINETSLKTRYLRRVCPITRANALVPRSRTAHCKLKCKRQFLTRKNEWPTRVFAAIDTPTRSATAKMLLKICLSLCSKVSLLTAKMGE